MNKQFLAVRNTTQLDTHTYKKSAMQVASIIFLESPAFVGWSYSNRTDDRTVGDKRTAEDPLSFLVGFFERFPTFKDRPFWIAGESYGGVSPHHPSPPSPCPFHTSNLQTPFQLGDYSITKDSKSAMI